MKGGLLRCTTRTMEKLGSKLGKGREITLHVANAERPDPSVNRGSHGSYQREVDKLTSTSEMKSSRITILGKLL
ncbi:hypothetical protein AXF42_Ash013395 [Apostasia shenzhenica]|uniref:Uncharacterized protein n=1 Tax=Apostasia shenzhenica TaxID=1088818 RepID=A0A2I0A438_9ASPA|nr:hypothetical protein AXF42_Ash013395 [Apostasia shenzhenica]